MKNDVLERLTVQWIAAKDREAEANAERLQIEQQICAALPPVGAECVQRLDMGTHALKVTYKVTRTVDSDALQALWDTIDAKAQKAFSWKASVKVGELRKLQDFMPEQYAKLAACIETKPAKPSIEIAEIEKAAA
jgi:phage-related protein